MLHSQMVLCNTAIGSFLIFHPLCCISLVGRFWWMSATTSRRIYTLRPTLSICRGKRKIGNNLISQTIQTCYGPCGLNHQSLVEHGENFCCLLCRLIPGAHVVKSFNTLSAWALQNGPSDANRQVLTVSVSQMLQFLFDKLGNWICLK